MENQRVMLKQSSAESSKLVFIVDLADLADSAESEGVWSNQAYSQPHGHSQPHHLQPHSQSHGKPYTKPYLNLGGKAYIEPAILDELQNQQNQRFYDFQQNRIPFCMHAAFTAGMHR